MAKSPSILVVDNYDSFVYNIVQYLGELGAKVQVLRNDEVSASDLEAMNLDGVLISPGPGHPSDAGNCIEIIMYCAENNLELFGVCLGHQALAEAFGGVVSSAPELVHGRSSLVAHNNTGVFAGAPNPMVAGRYHSLVVQDETLPDVFEVTARTGDLIMGMRHKTAPLEGVQFHPESVLTESGYLLLANWLERCGASEAVAKSGELNKISALTRQALPHPAS